MRRIKKITINYSLDLRLNKNLYLKEMFKFEVILG